jgi:outer membrane protein assembly factor BamA
VGGEHDGDLRDGGRDGWVKYGGALTGAVDLDGHHRVLSLTGFVLFVDPMRRDVVIPFTELASLGGLQPMRAYLAGRLIDRSAFVTTLEYRWPVWAVLDGSIKAELGNVFDARLNDFALDLLRFSGSIGVETSGASDNPLQILFGVGSETFAQGGQIDSFRLFIGTTTNGL